MAGACSCYLDLSDELQKRVYRFVGPLLAACLEPWTYHRSVTSLSLFCRYYSGRCSSELVSLPSSCGRSTRYVNRLHDFSVVICRCYKYFYSNSFFLCAARMWNCLLSQYLSLTCNLNDFDSVDAFFFFAFFPITFPLPFPSFSSFSGSIIPSSGT